MSHRLQNKRALVLSGGGSKGAFQVGKIKQLTERGFMWDIITGVSVGALNTSFLAMYNVRDQRQAAIDLVELWDTCVTSNASIYKGWAPWILTYVPAIWKGSVYNTQPLKELLHAKFLHERMHNSDVEVYIGSCSVNTGLYKVCKKDEPKFLDFVLASASFPIAFPPVMIDGELYTDGGVRTVVPIMDAINAGATEIDVIMTSPVQTDTTSIRTIPSSAVSKIIPLALRVTDILLDEVFLMDIERIKHTHNVIINIFAPKNPSTHSSLDFSKCHIDRLMKEGYETI